MIIKSTYRVYEKNGIKYLQYLKLYKFWFLKWYDWEDIPYLSEKGKLEVISDQIPKYKNLKKFILENSDIEIYLNNEYVKRKNKFKKANNK